MRLQIDVDLGALAQFNAIERLTILHAALYDPMERVIAGSSNSAQVIAGGQKIGYISLMPCVVDMIIKQDRR